MPFDRDDSDFDEVPPDSLVPKNDRTIGDGTTTADHDTVTSELADTKRLPGDYVYAAAFPGADPDTRLDNAVSSVDAGSTIYLERDTYTQGRTIAKAVKLVGSNGVLDTGTVIDTSGTLTFNGRTVFEGIYVENGKLVFDKRSILTSVSEFGSGIEISGDNSVLTGLVFGDVTITSGTVNVIIDSCTRTTVTDNGSSNVIGDVV